MDFSKYTVLVTGASSGIGKEFAKQFHALGAKLILVARREELLEELKNEFDKDRPDSVVNFPCDLCSQQEIKKLIDYIKENEIDVLVNNAGRGSFGYFETLDIDGEISQVQLNIIATQQLTHAVIPQMKDRKSGAIISVSSIAAFQPLPLMATYAGTKAFNFMHSMALREELEPYNVNVLTLCPGPTATEFGGVARVPGKLTGGRRDSVEDVVKTTIEALGKNRAFVVPGVRSFGISLLSRLLPKTLSTWMVGRELLSTLKASKTIEHG